MSIRLRLTDSHFTPAEGLSSSRTFSADGSGIYLVYQQSGIGKSTIAAVVLRNSGGTIQYEKSIDSDPKFPKIAGGSASPDFKYFSILETSGQSEGDEIARIRVFTFNLETNTLELKVSREFTDYLSQSNSLQGGIIHKDTIFLSYLTRSKKEKKNEGKKFTVLRGFSLVDLEATHALEIEGVISSPSLFTLKNSSNVQSSNKQSSNKQSTNKQSTNKQGESEITYLVVGSGNCKMQKPQMTLEKYLPPAYLRIYQIGGNKLIETSKVSLSGFPQSVVPYCYSSIDMTLIAVGCDRMIGNSNAKVILKNHSSQIAYQEDLSNLLLYKFDGDKLEYLYGKNMEQGVRPSFHPSGCFLGANLYSVTNHDPKKGNPIFLPDTFSLFHIEENSKDPDFPELNMADIPRIAPSRSQTVFSPDGRWMLISGSSLIGDDTSDLLCNINLYEFTYTEEPTQKNTIARNSDQTSSKVKKDSVNQSIERKFDQIGKEIKNIEHTLPYPTVDHIKYEDPTQREYHGRKSYQSDRKRDPREVLGDPKIHSSQMKRHRHRPSHNKKQEWPFNPKNHHQIDQPFNPKHLDARNFGTFAPPHHYPNKYPGYSGRLHLDHPNNHPNYPNNHPNYHPNHPNNHPNNHPKDDQWGIQNYPKSNRYQPFHNAQGPANDFPFSSSSWEPNIFETGKKKNDGHRKKRTTKEVTENESSDISSLKFDHANILNKMKKKRNNKGDPRKRDSQKRDPQKRDPRTMKNPEKRNNKGDPRKKDHQERDQISVKKDRRMPYNR